MTDIRTLLETIITQYIAPPLSYQVTNEVLKAVREYMAERDAVLRTIALPERCGEQILEIR